MTALHYDRSFRRLWKGEVEVQGVPANAGDFYRDNISAFLHDQRPISAHGGQGGCGHSSRGGANENGDTQWRCDRIPFDHFDGIGDVPPRQNACFKALPDFEDKEGGPTVGAGGDGSPGLIQLHVPDPAEKYH